MSNPFDQPMSNRSATDANKVPGAPLTISEVLPGPEGDQQPPPLEPEYKPFHEESALRESVYQPYSEKPGLYEPPYEPYKGM